MILKPRHRKVLFYRWGIGYGGITHTLEETAKKHGVTRERIRMIEQEALNKISSQILHILAGRL
jgi:DNA-directed RNA polymerase sigma subunit (sigma70/sigma32)